jgi:hypothetical protein
MWPPGHLAVAYLLVSWQTRVRGEKLETAQVLALAVGSQLPDLLDKPLAWVFALPSGRTLGHSLLFLVSFVVVSALLTRRLDRPALGTAASVGALSHLVADAVPALWDPDTTLTFLLWPLVSTTPYEEPFPGLWELAVASASDLYLLFEVALVAAALVSWRRDGYPGLR